MRRAAVIPLAAFGVVCLTLGGLWLREDGAAVNEPQPSEARRAISSMRSPGEATQPAGKGDVTSQFIEAVTNPALLWASRHQALAQLGRGPLDASQARQLMDYVKSPIVLDPGGLEEARFLRNDILTVLRDSGIEAHEVIVELSALARDRQQDAGLRDYALQHMAEWMPQLREDTRGVAEAVLLESLSWKEESYAGTGLIGLGGLAAKGLLAKPFFVGPKAREVLLDADYSILSRMTAMAIVNEEDKMNVADEKVLALARSWQSDEAMLVGARRAATNYLEKYEQNGRGSG